MATREELIAQVQRKRLMEQVAAKRAGQTEQAPEQPEMSTGDTVLGAVNAFGQGATLNFADEIGSGLAAGAVKVGDWLTGNENSKSYGDVYTSMMDSEKQKRDAFAAANPKTALGLEVAGGFATGGMGGAKVLGTNAIKNAPKLTKALAASGVGAGEGAVAGFGAGDSMDERLSGAGTGATIGAVLPLALSGAGAGLRAASNKYKLDRPAEVLDGVQEPLNLVDPHGWRGKFYRDTVGTAMGGRKIAADSAPFVQRAQDLVDAKTARVGEIAQRGKNVNYAINKQGGGLVGQAKQTGKQQVDDAIQAQKLLDSTEANALDNTFRKEMTEASLPANFSDEGRAILDDVNVAPTEKMDRIAKEWTKNGFASLKEVTFDIDQKTFKAQMKGLFDGDPALDNAAGKYMTEFNKRLKKAIDPKTGQMDGDKFMELRNQYARAANKTSDPMQRQVFRSISSKVDDLMIEGMPKGTRAAFEAEKAAYDTSLVLNKSTASAASKKAGEFTPDEWLTNIPKNRRGRGKGPQQTRATEIQQQKQAIKEAQAAKLTALPERQAAADALEAAKKDALTRREAAQRRTAAAGGRAKEGLVQAKQALADIKFSTPAPKPSLATRLISTGLLGSPAAAFGPMGAMGVLGAGAVNARVLSSDLAQRVISGQSLDQTLTKLGGISTPSGLSLADILRQGTAAGAVQYTTE